MRGGRHPADHADAQDQRVAGRRRRAAGSRRARPAAGSVGVGNVADRAQRPAVRAVELEPLGDRGRDGERALGRGRRRRPGRRQARRWRRSARPARCARSGFRSPARRPAPGRRSGRAMRRRPRRDAVVARPTPTATPIGSSAALRIRSSLAAVGSAAKRWAALVMPRPERQRRSGRHQLSLPSRSRKSSGTYFAQRVVVDRAQRPAEVGGAVLARALLAWRGIARRALAPPGAPCFCRCRATRPACHSTSRPPSRGYKRAHMIFRT